jgi:hypothetical protein
LIVTCPLALLTARTLVGGVGRLVLVAAGLP